MQRFLSVFHFLAAWPLVLVFLFAWNSLFVFTPAEVTELQAIPLMLQGGTDWGDSNFFAAHVVGHFLFGIIGCYLLTAYFICDGWRGVIGRILIGMILAFLIVNGPYFYYFVLAVSGGLEPPELSSHGSYFICDYIQIFAIFTIAYIFSGIWIRKLQSFNVRPLIRWSLCPLVMVILALVSSTGITPKAGKVLQSYVIPDYSSNSPSHSALLLIHKLCTSCTGGYEAR